MRHIKRTSLTLSFEQIRQISGRTGVDANGSIADETVRTLDLTSNISAKSGCQGTQFCCKPP